MSGRTEAVPVPPASFDRREYRRILASSFLGTAVEYYDFVLYGAAAALVFGPLFFAGQSPATALILSFATFAVGYLARPLGSVIFGHLGDRVGRKSTLVLTMSIMGVASTLMGLLPTSAQIGALAPVLLLLLRIVQGLAVGGEWGGGALMGLESAPPGERGFGASAVTMGSPAGSMTAALTFGAFAALPEDQFLSWGWRVPFLLSAVLLGIALFVRLRIAESPMFVAAQARAEAQSKERRAPIMVVLTRYRRAVLLTALVSFAAFVHSSFYSTFALSAARTSGTGAALVLVTSAAAGFVMIFGVIFFARLSDRIGRRPVLLIGCGISLVMAVPYVLLLTSGNWAGVLVAFVLTGLTQAALYGPLAAFISEQFETSVRYTGAGLTYQIGAVLAGFTPIVSTALWGLGRGVFGAEGSMQYAFVAGFIVCGTLISLGALQFVADTRQRVLEPGVDAPVSA